MNFVYPIRFVTDRGKEPVHRFRHRLHCADRISIPSTEEIMFRNGYRKDSLSFIAKCTLSVGKGKEEWGAEKGKEYFVLTICEIWKV